MVFLSQFNDQHLTTFLGGRQPEMGILVMKLTHNLPKIIPSESQALAFPRVSPQGIKELW